MLCRNRSGVWKNWLRVYKTGNIYEAVEDRAKVTVNNNNNNNNTLIYIAPACRMTSEE